MAAAAATAISLTAYVQAGGPDALGAKSAAAAVSLSVDGRTTLGCSGAFVFFLCDP